MRIEITAHVRDGLYPLASALLTKEGFFMPHTQQTDPQPDFRVTYHGTITTITPLSDACREWLEDNVEIEPWQARHECRRLRLPYTEWRRDGVSGKSTSPSTLPPRAAAPIMS